MDPVLLEDLERTKQICQQFRANAVKAVIATLSMQPIPEDYEVFMISGNTWTVRWFQLQARVYIEDEVRLVADKAVVVHTF